MKIMYVTSECAPFIKTGGLGDVAGSLPQALAAKGHDVRVFCPLYSAIDQSMYSTGISARLIENAEIIRIVYPYTTQIFS